MSQFGVNSGQTLASFLSTAPLDRVEFRNAVVAVGL